MPKRSTNCLKILLIVICAKVIIALMVFYYVHDSYDESHLFQERKVNRISDFLPIVPMEEQTEPPMWRLKQLVAKELPSLPLQELLANEHRTKRPNDTCAPYPLLRHIKFHNDYWQEVQNGNKIYYIFGAYYDKRKSVPHAPLIRVLTMINEIHNNYPKMYCQMWFPDLHEALVVPVLEYNAIWYDVWGNTEYHFYPTLISCALPEGDMKHKVPSSVSLVSKECEQATNVVRVHYEELSDYKSQAAQSKDNIDIRVKPTWQPPKKRARFAVCIKALDFPYVDMSTRLVEWLEMLRILGAEKVTIYNDQMHPNMIRVLRHYENTTGFVDLRGYSMARGEPHTPQHFHHFAMAHDNLNRILSEIIPYNDCFYRNLYQYDYIAVCDIDEVIMPLGNFTDWSTLIEALDVLPEENTFDKNCEGSTSYCFRNIYFPKFPEKPPRFPDLPEYFYMLQHVERVAEHRDLNSAIKCLHTTKYAVGLHNHFPLFWVQDCGIKSVPINMGQMQHYREPDVKSTLLNTVIDKNIWRFYDQLVNRTNTVLRELYLRHPECKESVN